VITCKIFDMANYAYYMPILAYTSFEVGVTVTIRMLLDVLCIEILYCGSLAAKTLYIFRKQCV
jgi:hypothetical protein